MNWPSDYKCRTCGKRKPPDEIDWNIWGEFLKVVCIDCAPEPVNAAHSCKTCGKDIADNGLCGYCELGLF